VPYAPHSPPVAFSSIEEVAEELRRRGGRFSTPRRLVLEALFAADHPISADEIAAGDGERIDLTSVYRALEYLEELGVAHHLHLGHGPARYVLTGGEEREYLVCERCGRISSFDSAELDGVRAEVRKASGYEARFSHFPIVGLCGSCSGH
jgi:Fur family transcriptional regulator, ferric uptake regulator